MRQFSKGTPRLSERYLSPRSRGWAAGRPLPIPYAMGHFLAPLRGLALGNCSGAEAEGLEGNLDVARDGFGDAERMPERGQRDLRGLQARGIARKGGLDVRHGVAAQLAQAI